MVGKVYSVIVPIEVPEYINDHEILNLEKYPDKLEVLRKKSFNPVSLTTYPCISNKFFVAPQDIFGNIGELSDTIEVFYTPGEWSCLKSISGFSEDKIYTKFGNILYFNSIKPVAVKIFDPSGRLIFNKEVRRERISLRKGGYFIIIGGKVKKEVLR